MQSNVVWAGRQNNKVSAGRKCQPDQTWPPKQSSTEEETHVCVALPARINRFSRDRLLVRWSHLPRSKKKLTFGMVLLLHLFMLVPIGPFRLDEHRTFHRHQRSREDLVRPNCVSSRLNQQHTHTHTLALLASCQSINHRMTCWQTLALVDIHQHNFMQLVRHHWLRRSNPARLFSEKKAVMRPTPFFPANFDHRKINLQANHQFRRQFNWTEGPNKWRCNGACHWPSELLRLLHQSHQDAHHSITTQNNWERNRKCEEILDWYLLDDSMASAMQRAAAAAAG